jgi:hypothetical protein
MQDSMPYVSRRCITTTSTHHEHGCTLKLMGENSMRKRRIHELVHVEQAERQLARLSNVSSLLWRDSTSDRARKHFLPLDLNTSLNV